MSDIKYLLGLILLVGVIFVLIKWRILPKKSLPFLIAAIAVMFGLSILRKTRMNSLRKDLKKREEDLKKKEKELKNKKDASDNSEKELNKLKADFNCDREKSEKDILKIDKDNEEEKKQIDSLSGDDLHNEFRKIFKDND